MTSRFHGRVVNERTLRNRGQGRHHPAFSKQLVPDQRLRRSQDRRAGHLLEETGRGQRRTLVDTHRHPLQTETSLACGWMPLHGCPLYPCPHRANEEISPDRRITRLMGQRGSSVEIVSCREWDSYAISYLCWFYRLECSERRWQYNDDRFTRMPGRLCLQNQAPRVA